MHSFLITFKLKSEKTNRIEWNNGLGIVGHAKLASTSIGAISNTNTNCKKKRKQKKKTSIISF